MSLTALTERAAEKGGVNSPVYGFLGWTGRTLPFQHAVIYGSSLMLSAGSTSKQCLR